MKRKLVLTIVTFTIIATLAIGTFLFHNRSEASPGPLPTSLDVSGTNLALLGPIQVPSGAFTVAFDYTPLNQTGSVLVLSEDKQIINYKNDPSGNPGSLVLPENYSGPVYIQTYGATWHLTAR